MVCASGCDVAGRWGKHACLLSGAAASPYRVHPCSWLPVSLQSSAAAQQQLNDRAGHVLSVSTERDKTIRDTAAAAASVEAQAQAVAQVIGCFARSTHTSCVCCNSITLLQQRLLNEVEEVLQQHPAVIAMIAITSSTMV